MKLIGGLTRNQRGKAFRLIDNMQEYSRRVVERMNDDSAQSFRVRTIAARRLAGCARDLHRVLART